MAIHSPITTVPRVALSLRRREAIETEIETHFKRIDFLIRRLDRADAPFEDLEEDDHHGGDVNDAGEMCEYYPMMPKYSVDQSIGPINAHAIMKDHRDRMNGVRM